MILKLLVHWLVSAVSLLIVAYVVPGFILSGFKAALIAAAAVGFVNGTLGAVLRLFTWPLRILTLGLLTWVINAAMLELAASLVDGFAIDGFFSAMLGSLVLAIVSTLLRWIMPDFKKKSDD
jgi:putative membrane protein